MIDHIGIGPNLEDADPWTSNTQIGETKEFDEEEDVEEQQHEEEEDEQEQGEDENEQGEAEEEQVVGEQNADEEQQFNINGAPAVAFDSLP